MDECESWPRAVASCTVLGCQLVSLVMYAFGVQYCPDSRRAESQLMHAPAVRVHWLAWSQTEIPVTTA